MPHKHVNPEKPPNEDAEARPAEIPGQTETGMYGLCITFGEDDSQLVLTDAGPRRGTRSMATLWNAYVHPFGSKPVIP